MGQNMAQNTEDEERLEGEGYEAEGAEQPDLDMAVDEDEEGIVEGDAEEDAETAEDDQ